MPNYTAYDSPARPDPNCRTCTDFKTWSRQQREISKQSASQTKSTVLKEPVEETPVIRDDCPLDKDTLGQSTWGLLHTMAAVYPAQPNEVEKRDVKSFYDALSRLYPCKFCADDFQIDLKKNPVDVHSQATLSEWLCNFHNRVNKKLGKPIFDCSKVNERWRDGWKDGSCD